MKEGRKEQEIFAKLCKQKVLRQPTLENFQKAKLCKKIVKLQYVTINLNQFRAKQTAKIIVKLQ